jgi:hypothetical protein
MTLEIKLPFGKTDDGRMVSVEAVARGLDCHCCCPECGSALVAAKGEIYRHHFRHQISYGACAHGHETAIHQFAKQLICERLFLRLPDPVGIMINATPEQRIGNIVPDVLADFDSGVSVAVEIWVAHQVPESKVREYNDRRLAAVEIDLRPYRFTGKTEIEWESAVLEQAQRLWLSPPEYLRKKREEERALWLAEQALRVKAKIAKMEEAEREHAKLEKERAEFRELLAADMRRRRAEQEAEIEQERHRRAEENDKIAELRLVQAARLRRERRGPDLQELVSAHGSWDRVTPEAWASFEQERANWQARVATGWLHAM